MSSRRALRSTKIGTASIPAPVGGLNAVDAFADMPATDAIQMDNWVPGVNACSIRSGYSAWATGFASPVETVMPYNSGTASKLFAAAGTSIYDVSSAGAIGAASVTGMTNSRWQYVNFGTAGGQFLLAVNSADKMRVYNGAAWGYEGDGTYPAVTGFNTQLAKDMQVYASRVWMIEKNSFRVWYLPLNSIGGAAASIDLSSLYILGGALAGMVTWQTASTYSIQTYAAFISTQGEVLLYLGSDPASAATWSKVGQFRIGRPIGQRFYERAGDDTLLITTDGIIPMSKAAITDRQSQSDAISYKIIQLVNNDMSTYAANYGWQVILYPFGNKLYVNVPKNATSAPGDNIQYVMNTITNKWCRYTGLGANCWALFNDSIYFGGESTVYQAETGTNDNGNAISAAVTPAYSYFGAQGQQKMFTACRPIITTNGTYQPSIGLALDFSGTASTSSPILSTASNSAVWNTSPWNTTKWDSATQTVRNWQWVGGIGFAATFTMSSSTKGMTVQWSSTDYTYERGGTL
jgi:hypothetical protein